MEGEGKMPGKGGKGRGREEEGEDEEGGEGRKVRTSPSAKTCLRLCYRWSFVCQYMALF